MHPLVALACVLPHCCTGLPFQGSAVNVWNWLLKDSPLQERVLYEGFALSLTNGKTTVRGWHCPRDRSVRLRKVRPWVGVCAPCFDLLVIRDPLSPRISWWNLCAVPSQQLPHVLCGAGA